MHLATHGFFVGARCPSALAVSPADPAATPAASRAPIDENPLLHCGIAFAGANRRDRASPDADDGILTADEIATMDLKGVGWAVLSGCETGRGEFLGGEGVLGLRRAFQVAGVRTIIMSLWPVEDEATRRWMEALYTVRFARGQSTAEAVRAACLDVLAERRARGRSTHPFYWGAFVAAGAWR